MFLTPSDIEELTGLSPDILRDWRRRGFLDGAGSIVLPDGSSTTEIAAAKLAGISRPAWLYSLGDAVRLAVARSVGGLVHDIRTQLALAELAGPHVASFACPHGSESALTECRYLAAWRQDDGSLSGFRCNDLNLVASTVAPAAHAIIVDMQREADRLPGSLKLMLRSRLAPNGTEQS